MAHLLKVHPLVSIILLFHLFDVSFKVKLVVIVSSILVILVFISSFDGYFSFSHVVFPSNLILFVDIFANLKLLSFDRPCLKNHQSPTNLHSSIGVRQNLNSASCKSKCSKFRILIL